MALLPSNEISDTPDFCKENSKQLTFVTIADLTYWKQSTNSNTTPEIGQHRGRPEDWAYFL